MLRSLLVMTLLAAPRLSGPTGATGVSPVSAATLQAFDTLIASSPCVNGAYVYGIANDGTPLCALSVLTSVIAGAGITVTPGSPGAYDLQMSGLVAQPMTTLFNTTDYKVDAALELTETGAGDRVRVKFRNGAADSLGYWMLQSYPIPNGGSSNQGSLLVTYQTPGGAPVDVMNFQSNGTIITTNTFSAAGGAFGASGGDQFSFVTGGANGVNEVGIRTQNSGAGLALAVGGDVNLIGTVNGTDYLDETTATATWLSGHPTRLPVYRSTLAGTTSLTTEAAARCYDEQDIIIAGSCIENGATNELEASRPKWTNSAGQFGQWYCRWNGGTGHSAVAICLKARN